MDPFEKFWPLVLDPDQEMTADERASLEYYRALDDVTDGLPIRTDAQRWTEMARKLRRLQVQLGRQPLMSDPEAPPLLEWVRVQRSSDLNSYQRTHLAWIGSWVLET